MRFRAERAAPGLSCSRFLDRGPEVFDVIGVGEEDLPVGNFAVDEAERIAVLGVETLGASLGGDPGGVR